VRPSTREVELAQLGEAVHQIGDFLAEQILNLGLGGAGVLDRIMQQRGGDGRFIEPEIGQHCGHFQRMGNVRITRSPALVAVRAHCVNVSAVEHRLIRVRVIPHDAFDKLILPHGLCPQMFLPDARRRGMKKARKP